MIRLIFGIVSTFTIFEGAISPAHAQSFQEIAPENPGVQEFFREGADIAGAVVMGVQVQTLAQGGPRLIGYLPQAWSGETACFHIVSSDGRYEAYGNYLVPKAWVGAPAVFQFTSEHVELLRAIPSDGVGVMVAKGVCGQSQAKELAPVLWNAQEVGAVDIMINSFNADEVFTYIGEDPVPVRCENLDLSNVIAFDRKCTIQAGIHFGPTKVEIYRLNNGKPSEPTPIVVWLPER